jgi:hypothetical protein
MTSPRPPDRRRDRVNRGAEPPTGSWINRPRAGDDRLVLIPFLNLLSACVVVYATVTRGGRLFARVLERLANR